MSPHVAVGIGSESIKMFLITKKLLIFDFVECKIKAFYRNMLFAVKTIYSVLKAC